MGMEKYRYGKSRYVQPVEIENTDPNQLMSGVTTGYGAEQKIRRFK